MMRLLLILLLLAGSLQAAGFRKRSGEEDARPKPEQLADSSQVADRGSSLIFLRSLAVPGWGEAVAARSRPDLNHRGRLHFWLDVGLIAGAVTLNHVGNIKRSEYQSYAMSAAGAADHSDGSDYWVNVSNYLSMEEYNLAMLQTGRLSRIYSEENNWEWSTRSEFIRYRDLRARSERAYSQALAVAGAILINHVLSGVHALQLSKVPIEATPTELGLGIGIPLDLQGAFSRR
jgi:hypothetical protein